MTSHDDDTVLHTDDEPTDDDESVLLTESEPGSVLPPDDEAVDDDEPEESGYFETTDATSTESDETVDDDEADFAEVPEPADEIDEVDDDDEADFAEVPEPVDETDEVEEPEVTEAVVAEEAVEPSPMERLAPVGADAPLDPGTGSVADRWTTIQAGFIDDPRRAVESASALVAQLWQDIERSIAVQQQSLEEGWQAGERSTDDLRVAMQEYRALYDRFVAFTP